MHYKVVKGIVPKHFTANNIVEMIIATEWPVATAATSTVYRLLQRTKQFKLHVKLLTKL